MWTHYEGLVCDLDRSLSSTNVCLTCSPLCTRVSLLLCVQSLKAMDRSGYSDPYVVVQILSPGRGVSLPRYISFVKGNIVSIRDLWAGHARIMLLDVLTHFSTAMNTDTHMVT